MIRKVGLLVILFVISCQKETSSNNPLGDTPPQYSFSANINGEEFPNGKEILANAILDYTGPSGGGLIIYLRDRNDDNSADVISIIIGTDSTDGFQVGDEFYGFNRIGLDIPPYLVGFGQYNEVSASNNSIYEARSAEVDSPAFYLLLTDFDEPNKLVSGEFEFTAVSDSKNDTFFVKNGRFKDISFN
jgi:hypothetical protein